MGERLVADPREFSVNEPDSRLIERATTETAKVLARFGIDHESVLNAVRNFKFGSDKEIAKSLAIVQPEDNYFKDLNPNTDQGVYDAGVLAYSKVLAVAEAINNPNDRAQVLNFGKNLLKKVNHSITSPLTKRLIEASMAGYLALYLSGCLPVIPGMVLPISGVDRPAVTEVVPTVTQTAYPNPTSTEIASPTPTEAPLPAEFKDLQDRLPNHKLSKGEGDYYVIDGVENVKFYTDIAVIEGYEHNGESYDLTVAKQVISDDEDSVTIGGWKNENGKWIMLEAGAPKTVEEANLLPKQALVQGPNWDAMNKTNRLYDQWIMEKTATYDPLDEFKGIIIDGVEVPLEDIAAPNWETFDYGDTIVFLGLGKSDYNPWQFALGQGWSNLVIFDADGNQVLDLINIPNVNLNSDLSITITNSLMNKDKLSEILDMLTKEKRNGLGPSLVRDAKKAANGGLDLANDDLLEFMANYNKAFLEQKILEDVMEKLASELGIEVYFVADN